MLDKNLNIQNFFLLKIGFYLLQQQKQVGFHYSYYIVN